MPLFDKVKFIENVDFFEALACKGYVLFGGSQLRRPVWLHLLNSRNARNLLVGKTPMPSASN
jgi:hypothetical protein